jgi:HEAT repeat protein
LDLLRGRVGDAAVRDTLLEVLRKDPDDGVRMKALETLRPLAAQADVRIVLLEALRADRNPMVRAHAVDVLTMGDAQNSDLAGALQELMQREENLDVRRQGQRVLRSMNASLETF